jgi:hypothetical protein
MRIAKKLETIEGSLKHDKFLPFISTRWEIKHKRND